KILDKEILKNLIIELHQIRNHPIRLIGIGVKLGEIDDIQMDLF
ncbi:DNA polymerase IV, partial [Francisella tularensis subsp. holarctica]|nr:DNA polymerase IV [Francisella tularensis subsp. holarctica]